MKKMMMIAAMMIAAVSANAQSDEIKHEIAISYGAASNSTWLSTMEDFATIPASFGTVSYDNGSFFGPLGVEYFYRVTPKIGIGAIGVFARETKDLKLGGKKDGDASNTYISILPAAKFNWVDKKHFGFYSKLALGMTIKSQKQSSIQSNTDVLFNFQATAIGLEAGSQHVRGFIELGVGEQGVFNAGVRARF